MCAQNETNPPSYSQTIIWVLFLMEHPVFNFSIEYLTVFFYQERLEGTTNRFFLFSEFFTIL